MMSFSSRTLATATLLTCTWATSARAQSCAADTDCASPLTCKEGGKVCTVGAALLPDGGTYVMDPVCQAQPSKCTWTFVRCQADSECPQANWGCLTVPGQTTVKTCFPKGMACSAAQTCPTGWSCIDFTEVYDSDPLQIWGVTGNNYCWPDSLNGVLYREIRVDSSGLDLPTVSGGLKGGTDAGSTIGVGTGEPGGTLDAGAPASSGSTDSTATSSKSGCTIGGRSTSAPWTLLATALLGLLALRRAARKNWLR